MNDHTFDTREYAEFLDSKTRNAPDTGLKTIPPLNEKLFPFQRDIVAWALRKGRAAIFADCGMGKTAMQLEWAKHTPGRVLILTPLAVARQTVQEGEKFGVAVVQSRGRFDPSAKIVVTNYEMMDHFDASEFDGVVLDESSILKAYDGKTRTRIIEAFQDTRFKLACSATPAPNDIMEIGNHAEFLNVMSRSEMLAMFFVHDGGETQKWRLKGHAEDAFWRWICTWAVNVRRPSDLGYDDGGFVLPPLRVHQSTVESDAKPDGYLFAKDASTLQERIAARRDSIEDRAEAAAQLIQSCPDEQWIVWCNLNAEAEAVCKLIGEAVNVQGSDSPEAKIAAMTGFSEGAVRVLVTKPSIAGFGMNWQQCHNQIFLGLSDSYESYYQAVRRCWRFGQSREVNVHIITSETEGAVVRNIERKDKESREMADRMAEHMMEHMRQEVRGSVRRRDEYRRDVAKGGDWVMHLGDSVEVLSEIADDSIHFSIFSPPFSSLYTYSNSVRDLGNCVDHDEFVRHMGYIAKQLRRVVMPGRLVSFHCMNLPTFKSRQGHVGLYDFRGELIRMFVSEGFIYHSEVCIWKDPVTAMQRTKAIGLLHKQLKKDSSLSRQGIPDYLVTMRKPGDNPQPITHTNESFPVSVWQRYASPIWMDINPSDTLQFRSAREHNDEKHICPLQLTVIRRALELWTNPGDLVLSPFGGIGSEGFEAVKAGRRFFGIELKESYWRQAVKNLQAAERESAGLFAAEIDDDDTWDDSETEVPSEEVA